MIKGKNIQFCNVDLIAKYKENSSFKQTMNQNQIKYNQKLQQSFYSDLSKVNKQIIQISTQSVDIKNINGSKIYGQKKKVIYIYSHFQPQNLTQLHKIYLHFISAFPQPEQPFYLVYVNSTESGKSKFWSIFKSSILEQLPFKYLLYMEKLVLIRPSFFDKATTMVQFGVLNKFFRDKCQRYNSLKDYYDTIGMKFSQMKKFLPIEVAKQQFDETFIKPVFQSLICNLNSNRTSFLQQNVHQTGVKKNQNSSKQKKKKKGLEHYPTGQLGIPLALELMIFYFTQFPERCQTEGIFRKCTSIEDEQQLIKQLEEENYQILTNIENDIAVASAIKRFVSKLQPPLIPYQNYQKIVKDHSIQSIIQEIHTFPIVNFMTLMHLLKFMRDYIVPQSKKNLMTSDNISICLAPCIMRSKQITEKQFILATINVEVTKKLMEKFEDIFGDQEKQRIISRRTFKLYKRSSKQSHQSLQKQEENKHEHKIFPRTPTFGCPQDFLKPIETILEGQRQSESQIFSQAINENNGDIDIPQIAFNQQECGIPVAPKSSTLWIPQTNLSRQNSNRSQSGMKKYKSLKKLPCCNKDAVQVKQYEDKSADHEQIAKQDAVQSHGQETATNLNKLRAYRSKLGS